MVPLFRRRDNQHKQTSTRKTHTRRDPEKAEKDLELKKKRFEYESFLELVKKSPELKQKLVEKAFGIEVGEPDPAKQAAKEIDATLTHRALDRISKNPELADKWTDFKIRQILGVIDDESGEVSIDEQMYDVENPFSQYRKMKEFIDEEGGGKGMLGGLVDAETIKELLKLVGALAGISKGQAPAPYHITVDTPDGLVEMDATQYKNYLESKTVLSLPEAEEKPTSIRVKRGEPTIVEPDGVVTDEEMEEESKPKAINISKWSYLFGEDAETFVTTLKEEEEFDEDATLFLSLLSTKTSSEIMEMLQPVKEMEDLDTELREALDKVTEEWVVEVQGYLASITNGEI